MTAQIILDKRWPDAVEGATVLYHGRKWRKYEGGLWRPYYGSAKPFDGKEQPRSVGRNP